MIRTALVDDDIQFHDIFIEALKKEGIETVPVCYDTWNGFFNDIDKYDVVFLDIELNGSNGITLARECYSAGKKTIIVFVTSHNELMAQAFGLNVLSFLQKDRLCEGLTSVWNRIIKEYKLKESIILNTAEGKTIVKKISDIIYCELSGRNPFIYCDDSKPIKLKRQPFHDFYNMFSKENFIMIHRSAFVNISKIISIEKDSVQVKGINTPSYFSRDRAKDIIKAFMEIHAV